MKNASTNPEIIWDIGTAYDFFVSLIILHDPAEFGLRSAWAAGVRQRLPARDRETLEAYRASVVITPPLEWLYTLPKPKDGETLLRALKAYAPLERLYALLGLDGADPAMKRLVEDIVRRGAWTEADLENFKTHYQEIGKKKPEEYFTRKLDAWAQGGAFGDKLLHALQTYYEVFFAEEERRILPAIEAGLIQAQAFARGHTFQELFEEISQGVRYSEESIKGFPRIIFAPSFWASPFLFMSNFAPDKTPIYLFGSRPDDASLTPGELVPDALMASLNALADPTRLRILRYLSGETLTATQLATRLRLRPPTVVHHLKALRAAGLIFINQGGQKKDVYYQTRTERLALACTQLQKFVNGEDDPAGIGLN